MATVRALSNAVEARDAYTGKHAERVTAYGIEIARALGIRSAELAQLEFGFLLHDIGKLAIADAILFKPGPLTDEERALMAQHPLAGAEIVSGIEFLAQAAAVIRSHHERWDGLGYPRRAYWRGDPAGGARFLGGRRPRRPHLGPSLPPRVLVCCHARDDLCPSGTAIRPPRGGRFQHDSDQTFVGIRTEIG